MNVFALTIEFSHQKNLNLLLPQQEHRKSFMLYWLITPLKLHFSLFGSVEPVPINFIYILSKFEPCILQSCRENEKKTWRKVLLRFDRWIQKVATSMSRDCRSKNEFVFWKKKLLYYRVEKPPHAVLQERPTLDTVCPTTSYRHWHAPWSTPTLSSTPSLSYSPSAPSRNHSLASRRNALLGCVSSFRQDGGGHTRRQMALEPENK